MTREEAIKQIRLVLENLKSNLEKDTREAFETLIPELRESEYERIRKKILDIVRAAPFDEEKDILEDWLEKQEEIIPITKDDLCFFDNSLLRYRTRRELFEAGMKYAEEKQKEIASCSVDEFTLTLRDCLSVDSELTKEQADIFAAAYGEGLLNVAVGKIKSCLTEKEITDFKAEKQKEQKRWSEEDERKIGRLRSIVNECASRNYALDVNGDYCEGDYAELDEWLKSLRPSWKPTEEQMEMLAMFVNLRCVSRQEATTLESLYNGIKKLM